MLQLFCFSYMTQSVLNFDRHRAQLLSISSSTQAEGSASGGASVVLP